MAWTGSCWLLPPWHLARRSLPLEKWVASGSMGPECADLLHAVIATRTAFLVSGGTGSGKTTLLASLLSLVPDDQRLLVVEDSRELSPQHPHCVRLEARQPNAEGAGFRRPTPRYGASSREPPAASNYAQPLVVPQLAHL